MLGLSDRTALFDLYESLMSGQIETALHQLDMQYKSGADALVIAQDMLALTHWLTRVKITPSLVEDITIPEAERNRGKEMSQKLSMGSLTSAWQMLLKGLDEVRRADNPLTALEMVLIRLAYLSDLPSPAQLAEDIKKNGLTVQAVKQNTVSSDSSSQNIRPTSKPIIPQVNQRSNSFQNTAVETVISKESKFKSIADMAQFARTTGERLLAYNIENYIRPVSMENFVLTCDFTPDTPDRFSAELVQFLSQKAGENWRINRQSGGNLTIKEKKEEKQNLLIEELSKTPIVAQVLKSFTNSKVGKVKQLVTIPEEEDETEKIYDEL